MFSETGRFEAGPRPHRLADVPRGRWSAAEPGANCDYDDR